MTTTAENLQTAFAGESKAFQKYSAFAKKAEKEGFHNIAKLFQTTAEAERIHAEGHLNSMEGIGSTFDNLKASIAGETYEYTEMYPPMVEQAETDNHKARRMFNYALKVEQVHDRLYQMALEAVSQGKDLSEANFYLCPVCGQIELGKPPEQCPVCNARGAAFVQL